ncbi:Uncharacterised protein [Ectopseudomonas oleovorans]|jgi:hypothetical protein|uniref:Lipoprotein n=1 Tax=Ectopseudomonas oleovorans TaxID=301 RepID=A0A379K5C8_ECTOL|nr:hypothetical protein [Pseudomonas oleovorans]SUD59632.1 Uncharacterised protein [Pseudomonas oleovorans]
MRFPLFAVMILASSIGGLAWAQEPMRMPSAPEAGSPGTATPQPYGQPSTAVPIKRQGSAPLLPPPQGQPLPGATPRSNGDQPIPQLDEQMRRNSQGLDGQRKQD